MAKFVRSSIIVEGPTFTITPVPLPVSNVRPAPQKKVFDEDEGEDNQRDDGEFGAFGGEDTDGETSTSDSGYSSEDTEEEAPVVIPKGKKTGMRALSPAKAASVAKVAKATAKAPSKPTERRKRPTRRFPSPCIYDEYSFNDFLIEFERPYGELYEGDPETFDEHIANMKANLYRVIFFDTNERKFYTKHYEGGAYTWKPIVGQGVYPIIYDVHIVLVEVPESTTTKTVRGKIITETVPASTKAVPVVDFRYVKLYLSRTQIEKPYVYGLENPAKELEVNVAKAFPWKPVGELNKVQRAKIDKFMKMIGILFCDGDYEDTPPTELEYNTFFLAALIIYRFVTGERAERICVLTGEQGAGKSMLISWICEHLWGNWMGKVTHLSDITGCNFNSGWIDSFFLGIEEAKSKESDLISDSNQLKDMCTAKNLNAKTKSVPDVIKNKELRFNMFMLSNYAYPVYINDIDDRRFFVLRANKQWTKNFYKDFADCLNGLAPLLYQWGVENKDRMIQEVRDKEVAPMTIYKESIVDHFTQRKLGKSVGFFDIPSLGHTGTESFLTEDYLETDKYIVIKIDKFFNTKYKVDPYEMVTVINNLALEGVRARYKRISKTKDGISLVSRQGIEITKTGSIISACTAATTQKAVGSTCV